MSVDLSNELRSDAEKDAKLTVSVGVDDLDFITSKERTFWYRSCNRTNRSAAHIHAKAAIR